jgi:hypothetical protein
MAIIRAKPLQKHSAAISATVYILADDNRKGTASHYRYLPSYICFVEIWLDDGHED